jgi:chromosome segregation ATPase
MTKEYLKKINIRIKNSKEKLSSLFEEKRLATTKEKRIKIQKNINLLQEARIELFDIKNGLKIDIDRFQSKLKKVNKEIKDIYTEIKRI